MNFGDAIEIMKADGLVSRHGWNGKEMYVFLENGYFPCGPRPDVIDGVSEKHFDIADVDDGICMPHLVMQTESGASVIGWLASQTDILAEDWCEVVILDDDDHGPSSDESPDKPGPSPELESLLMKLGIMPDPKEQKQVSQMETCDCDLCWLEDLLQRMDDK
jgi:hypothetical protein